MKKVLFLLFTFYFLLPAAASAQVSSDTPKYGVTLPATCNPLLRTQVLFYKFGTGNGLYYCAATNTWALVASAGGSGTVTSVGLSLPSIFNVSGSPVTTAGSFGVSLAGQSQNLIFASPNGSSGAPGFRALAAGDIPNLPASIITSGTFGTARLGSGTADSTTFLRGDGSWAVPSGSGGLNVGDTIGSLTAGSVLFGGTSGVLAQNNTDFSWNNSAKRLKIGGSSPNGFLTLGYYDAFYNGLWFGQSAPDTSNYALLGTSSQTFINASTGGSVVFRINNTNYGTLDATSFTFEAGSAARVPFRIQRTASQTANLFNFLDSNGSTVLASFDKNAVWLPPSVPDGSAPNSSVYFSTTGNDIVFKNSSGTVQSLTAQGSGSTASALQTGTSLPGSCTVGAVYMISTSGRSYECTATNTWSEKALANTSGSSANQILGLNSSNNGFETKSILGTNLTVTHGTNSITLSPDASSITNVLTGTSVSNFVTPDAAAALWEQGADVASAGTVSLGDGGYFNITGTTTITDIDFTTDKAGRRAWLKFAGALTLTYNASTLILPTSASVTTAAGDTAEIVSEGADVIRIVSYNRANGQALAGGGGGGQSSIQFKDEGSNLSTSGAITSVDCVGSGVTCTQTSNALTLTVSGGGGSQVFYRDMLTGSSLTPDNSGNVYLDAYPNSATNDFWKHSVWMFGNPAADEKLYGTFELPAGCTSGASFKAVYSSLQTSGTLQYSIAYRVVTGDDTNSLDQSSAVETVTGSDTAPGAANRRMEVTLSPTNSNFSTAGTVEWIFTRIDASDTLAGSIALHGLKFSCTL